MTVLKMVLSLLGKVLERPDAPWLLFAASGFVLSVAVLVLALAILRTIPRNRRR